MPDYRLGRIDETVKDQFNNLCTQAGFEGQKKDRLFLTALLDRWEKTGGVQAEVSPLPASGGSSEPLNPESLIASLPFTPEETDELREGLERLSGPIAEFLRIGILAELRRALRVRQARQANVARLETIDLTQPQQRARIAGAGDAYIAQTVREMMQANLQATPDDRIYITRNIIAAKTGSLRKIVNRYFDEHAVMLEEHHQQIGFASEKDGMSHNWHRGRSLKQKSTDS